MAGGPAPGCAGGAQTFFETLAQRLSEHAQAQFRLSKREPDGATRHQHLLVAQRRSGKALPELQLPKLPRALQPLWQTFLDLHQARGAGATAPAGISWQDVLAWQRLHGVRLNAWELSVIARLDRVVLDLAQDKTAKAVK